MVACTALGCSMAIVMSLVCVYGLSGEANSAKIEVNGTEMEQDPMVLATFFPSIVPPLFPAELLSAEKLQPKNMSRGFPGGLLVKNLPTNARDNFLSGKIPHAVGQISPCATTTEALSP